MIITIIYAVLFCISFIWLVRWEPEFHKKTNHFYGSTLFLVAAFFSSFLLLGILGLIIDASYRVRMQLTIWGVQFIVWRIKRKYKIK